MVRVGSSKAARLSALKVRTGFVVLAMLCVVLSATTGSTFAQVAEYPVRFAASKPFTSSRVQLTAEMVRPEGEGPFPAVVLMHGCGGWQPAVRHALRKHTMFLRNNGFVVLNVDSFGPRGLAGGVVCNSLKRLKEARDYRTHDAFDALRYLRQQPFVDPERVFLIGQSNGGSVAIKAAEADAAARYNGGSRPFRAIVAYYPWCGTLGTTRLSLGSPLMIFGGGRDDWVPPAKCRQFRANGADLEVTIYAAAAHSFDLLAPEHRYLGKLVGFNRHATEDSRLKLLAFFQDQSQ